MMKDKKLLIVITTILIFIPTVVGLIYWDQLPAEIPTHWGTNGEVDGYSSKTFSVFGMPAIMAGLHLFCVFSTAMDPKEKGIAKKAIGLVLWIIPVISIVVSFASFGTALGMEIDIPFVICMLLGVLFIALGNYMPKTRQNFTFGVKTPWAIMSEENWNKTNRFGGWCMIGAGVVCFINAWIGSPWLFLALLPAAFAPMIYSYILYKKGI